MNLSFLGPLYARQGPYASVRLDTSRDIDDPDRAIALRWRHLGHELDQQGADKATRQALGEVVGSDRDVPGPHGQAVFAARGEVLLSAELPHPPAHDAARFSSLPDAMPVALQRAPDIGYAVVLIHRISAEETSTAEDELDVRLQTGRWPVSAVDPDTRAQRRHRYPASAWPQHTAQVLDDMGDLVDLEREGGTDTVVVCGEVWERGVLVNQMPATMRACVVAVEEDANGRLETDGRDRALLEDTLGELLRGCMSAQDTALTETFLEQRARGWGRAVEGLDAAVEALQRAQVRALLLNPPADLSTPIWVGREPTQLALQAADLRHYGAGSVSEQPADAALLRALVGTGAQLVVVPDEELTLEDRLGALLRYPDPSRARSAL